MGLQLFFQTSRFPTRAGKAYDKTRKYAEIVAKI
jgi:hypothetical protein